MRMKSFLMSALLVTAFGVCIVGCRCHCRLKEEKSGSEIPLSDVPQAVKDAATKAVAGINLTEAEIEKKDLGTVYELKGESKGEKYEIKVTPEGKVIKTSEDEKKDSDKKDDDNREE